MGFYGNKCFDPRVFPLGATREAKRLFPWDPQRLGQAEPMGIHPTSLFAVRPEALVEARQDIWLWAEPVIVDCAINCYDRELPSRLSSTLLARKHIRLWNAIIHEQAAPLTQALQDLDRTSKKFGMKSSVVHDVNAAILEELFDIMLFRYRGSIRATKASTLIMMAASSTLSDVSASLAA